eukprot:4369149-Alexandrium_andersonii.AAC.1
MEGQGGALEAKFTGAELLLPASSEALSDPYESSNGRTPHLVAADRGARAARDETAKRKPVGELTASRLEDEQFRITL